MPTWDELFRRGVMIAEWPEAPVQRFISLLERSFPQSPLRIWDLCCGAGRHTVSIAQRGHKAFASDASPSGVALLKERLSETGLEAETAVADMSKCPWAGTTFHGVLAWDSLHHNVVSEVEASVNTVHRHLIPGGLFLLTLKSTKADSFGLGKEIEPGTFVQDSGDESGVPHHYFAEVGIRRMFRDWELLVLLERVCTYHERGEGFQTVNPFDYTCWCVLARKHGRFSKS
jgi:SAM-dependent methyltransferase